MGEYTKDSPTRQHKDNMTMADNNGETIFECNFTDASLFDRLSVWCFSVGMILVFAFIPKHGYAYLFAIIFSLIYVLVPLCFEFMIYMIRKRSFIKLTDNNEILVKRWMCRSKSFPIDKIESIRVVDFAQTNTDKLTRDYMLPMPMGKVDLYPSKGVIVFFDRKWIKSVRLIFFNPAYPEEFATALAKKSGKPVQDED